MASKKSTDHGQSEVEQTIGAEVDQGFRGEKVDPTPNENYTVDGVTSGKPTPETDAESAEAARAASRLG